MFCQFLGNDLGDEDVDIHGNEPPISSYPPLEIEKDTAHRNSKCVSPGSSSGRLSLSSRHLCSFSFLKFILFRLFPRIGLVGETIVIPCGLILVQIIV